ncbi:hypothetical protein F511_24969 [Dorcoceras hygrometricum]|uniref:Uncharacterized protein n=1 Tax=Dorcoceras hygrometricum TaxID=472368 RepID=A0A2Z7D9Q4_9LAMI|nr:hypothetical protein F511_24969 [Dorcoceras hygrometricum]
MKSNLSTKSTIKQQSYQTMQYFERAMHECYQESSVGKIRAQRLSYAYLIIILRSSGATTQPTITGKWYSGATTQPATTSKAALDLSGTTTQPADVQRNSSHKGIKLNMEHCDVLSMQIDSDLVIYQTTLIRTFQVVTIYRVEKSEVLVVLISPHDSKRH